MHDVLDPWQNPVTYAVPFFLLFIGLELAALKWLDHDDNVTGYLAKDARASIGSRVTAGGDVGRPVTFPVPVTCGKLPVS